jgi:TRAP-type mannitol/chloroaromatic compound transport system substrate-binding protein
MGFYKAAKFYYYPGWHEPGTTLEFMVNKQKFAALPKDLQEIVVAAGARSNMWTLCEFEAKNESYLKKLVDEHNVKLRKFPDSVLIELKKFTGEVLEDLRKKDPFTKKVCDSYKSFQTQYEKWNKISEVCYANALNLK